MNFEEAKRAYVHRYTCEHVPAWAKESRADGTYYAPQYRTDREWFENTVFPPNNPFSRKDCESTNESWPLGQVLQFRPEHAIRRWTR